MKRKVLTRNLIVICLAIITAVCLGFGIAKSQAHSVIAEEPNGKVEIVGCNLSFQDSIKLMYAVRVENISEENFNKIEVLVWKNGGKMAYRKPTNNYSLPLYRIEEIQGEKYAIFLNDKIKAKELGDNLYAVPYYSSGEYEYYGEMVKYSPLDYAYDMRGSKESDADLDKVITSILNYGSATQEMTGYNEDRLVNSKFYQIKIHGGVLEDNSERGLFKKGEEIEITSTTDGFVCWVDSRDVVLSYEPTFTYTVSKNEVIKASTVSIEPDYDSNGLVYEKINDNEYRLIGLGTCTAKNIVVPKYYNEKPVTQVDNAVFRNNTEITSVTFDGGFDNFTQSMFNGCTSLERLVISGMYDKDLYWLFGTSITDIPETFVEIEFAKNSNYMDYSMFKGYDKVLCNHIVTLVLPEGITEIRESEFKECYALQAVKIPEGVTTIKRYAFYGCGGLTEIDLPESLLSIEDSAFAYCNFESVFIGKNVNYISGEPFRACSLLQNVEIDSKNEKYTVKGNCIIDKETKTLIEGFNSSIIPADGSVEIIGNGAFNECRTLQSINIPNTVKQICGSAFLNCDNLTDIEIPDSVESIGYWAFTSRVYEKYQGVYYVDNWAIEAVNNTITKVEFKEGTVGIAGLAFRDCSSLEEVSLEGIKYIGDRAFYNCSSLTSVEIPNSVTSIGDYAFEDCPIENATIPSNAITSISSSMLKTVVITSGDSICDDAFYNCSSLTSVTIPNSVKSIGDYAFYNCSSLTSIEIPEVVTSIGDRAFYNCRSLTSIEIPNSVTSIGGYAFYNCSSLTSIEIPNSVTSIGGSAFRYCSSFTSIEIPNSVTSIGEYAFYDCPIENATIPSNAIKSIPSSKLKAVVITSGDSICDYAFEYCSSLTSIEIPNSVTSIGDLAFYNCSSLTSVTIGNGVTSIGDKVFYNCSSLTNIIIPSSVTSIDNEAFCNCRSLTSVEIPNSVTSIGGSAFSSCPIENATIPSNAIKSIPSSKLKTVVITSGDSICDYAFSGCRLLTSITIPNSVTSIGEWAFNNCSSLTSVEIPNSVTSIGYGAFDECRSLTSVTIGNSVTSIGGSAFSGCSSLTSITIPNSVTSIGDDAFRNCSSLTSITIPNSVTSIGDYTFNGCSSLSKVYYKGTASERNGITIGSNNSALVKATCYYYSETQPTTTGNYWHYDTDGKTILEW